MQSCLELIPDDIERVFVAYSGGLDSSVLLHLALRQAPRFAVNAWHVNHGLVDAAGAMEDFCRRQAESSGIELRVDHLRLEQLERNIEAEARRRRYELFERHIGSADCVLTAHHADDQAETFLLNALRASGSAGLRGIARRRQLGDGLLLRPLLDYSRAELERYACAHEIAWFNDPSNRSNRFDRNYLRNEVAPRLRQRWPQFQNALASSCAIQAETQDLLDEVAASDLAVMRASPVTDFATLDLDRLLALSRARCKNLLRYWIAQSALPPLPQARLQELLQQLQARADALPQIAMPDYAIRIYDRRLFLVPKPVEVECDAEYRFGQARDIDIDRLGLHLTRDQIFERLQIEDRQQSLVLRFRQRGEQNRDRHRLKRLFQKHRIPPWQRSRVAQVYLDDRLEGLLP